MAPVELPAEVLDDGLDAALPGMLAVPDEAPLSLVLPGRVLEELLPVPDEPVVPLPVVGVVPD